MKHKVYKESKGRINMKALIIIDMCVRDVKDRYDKKKLIANQLKLIEAFNKAKQKIIVTGGKKNGKEAPTKNKLALEMWGDEISKEPEQNKIIPEILNSKYDYYINKHRYSAFFKTTLEKICKKEKITEMYFAGISSGICVHYTGVDAYMRDIRSILISDASGAPDEKTHNQNINRWKTALGKVMTTKEVIKNTKGTK
jgi:isochorismate hydrolase